MKSKTLYKKLAWYDAVVLDFVNIKVNGDWRFEHLRQSRLILAVGLLSVYVDLPSIQGWLD